MKFATIAIVLTLIIICSSVTLVGQDTDRKQGVNASAGNFIGEDAMHDEGMLAYCGVAAAEYVAQRLGVSPLKGDEYDRLKNMPVASLLDLRAVFEVNKLEAVSYAIDTREQVGWDRLSSLIESGSAQAILLVQAQSQNAAIEHFLVIERLEGDTLRLADPRSMSFFDISRKELFGDADWVPVQVVSRADARAIYAPVSPREWLKWGVLPLTAVISLLWRLCRQSSLRT